MYQELHTFEYNWIHLTENKEKKWWWWRNHKSKDSIHLSKIMESCSSKLKGNGESLVQWNLPWPKASFKLWLPFTKSNRILPNVLPHKQSEYWVASGLKVKVISLEGKMDLGESKVGSYPPGMEWLSTRKSSISLGFKWPCMERELSV